MNRYLEKLYFDKYLNVYVIFALDMLVSALSSLFAMLAFRVMFPAMAARGLAFALTWIISGVIGIGVAFYIMKTYRSVIRHSNLREIGRLCIAVFLKEVIVGVIMLAASFVKIGDVLLWGLLLQTE